MDKTYNIRCGAPLMLDHEYAHCANTVEFQGFGREQAISSVYLLLGRPVQLKIPLTEDFKVLVTAPITRKAGKVKAQLMECKLAEDSEEEYEYVRYSDIFEVVITPSLAEESQIEVTDPRLELIYTDMHEQYLAILQHEYTAEQSAQSAASSETNAAASATSAASSASAAYTSEQNASASATAAQGYATQAEGYKNAAASSASDASDSAAAAAQAVAFLEDVSATATTLSAGSSATAEYEDGVFSFGIPQGAKGDTGDTPSITVTSITGGHRITITVGSSTQIFDVMDGQNGQRGSDGVGIADVTLLSNYCLQITLTNGTEITTSSIRGETGATPDFSIGTVTTLEPNESATATITGTAEEPILNLGIPKGDKGDTGEVSEAELTEALYDKADVITNTASGSIASFSDGAEMPVKSLEVEINAVQDLHGQSNPYPAGGGVNQWLPLSGTSNGITFTPKEDGTVHLQGTFTADWWTYVRAFYDLADLPFEVGDTITVYAYPYGVVEFYDENNTRISYKSSNGGYGTVAIPTGTVRISMVQYASLTSSVSGTTINTDAKYLVGKGTITDWSPYSNICPISGWDSVDVYVSPTLDAEDGTTYPITLPQTVYGGKIKDGVLRVTHAIVDLGTLGWTQQGTERHYFISPTLTNVIKPAPSNTTVSPYILCDRYPVSWWNSSDVYPAIKENVGGSILVIDENYFSATASEFKSAMDGVQLVYELATPIEITLSDFPTIETLKGANNLWADCGDVAVIYRADTKAYIDGTIVDVPLAMIAPIEAGTTASKAYAVGEYFILNGNQFCKAKTAIASGATFTLNTNYTVTTIGAELKALQ